MVISLQQKKPYKLLECVEVGVSWMVGMCGGEKEDGKD